MPTISIYRDTENGETELLITGTVSRFVPARTYGPPERCHPAEGGDVEIVRVQYLGQDVDVDSLTKIEHERAEELLAEAAHEDEDDGYADYLMDRAEDERWEDGL